MKVIFIEDVTNVARAGQTKVVADGYARNYLFPRKLAVLANSQAAASSSTLVVDSLTSLSAPPELQPGAEGGDDPE